MFMLRKSMTKGGEYVCKVGENMFIRWKEYV